MTKTIAGLNSSYVDRDLFQVAMFSKMKKVVLIDQSTIKTDAARGSCMVLRALLDHHGV